MTIWSSNLSTSFPWQCSAISSSLRCSKHKLLVLIFMTSPHSVISQFITGMLASWPNNTSRHCSSLDSSSEALRPQAAAFTSAVGRAPQLCSPPSLPSKPHLGSAIVPLADTNRLALGGQRGPPPLTRLFGCPTCELRHKASSTAKT